LLAGTVGSASCTVTYTPNSVGTGTHTISGSYSGDTTHTASSGTFKLTVTAVTGENVQLNFQAFDVDDFENGVGQLQVFVNGHLVVDLPAGLNHLTGSGDYKPYDDIWVKFGPFDITSFVVPGENTIVFMNPLTSHFALVRNINISQGGVTLLFERRAHGISPGHTTTLTFSNPPLAVTSYTVDPTPVVQGVTVTFTAIFTGGSAPFTCSFTFGDGSPAVVVTTSAHTCSATHSYESNGDFMARVKITGHASTDVVRVFLHVIAIEKQDQQGLLALTPALMTPTKPVTIHSWELNAQDDQNVQVEQDDQVLA
jgi:hypothetical protein